MNKKSGKVLIPTLIAIGILGIAGAFIFLNQRKGSIGQQALSPQQVAERAINYINKTDLPEGLTASLIEITDEKEVYKIRLKIGEQEYESYASKDGRFLFPYAYDLQEVLEAQEVPGPEETTEPEASEPSKENIRTVGNFFVSTEEICKEEGKPIIYFFGSEGCSHCKWEHPIIEKVAEKFKGYISFHDNMNYEKEMEIFRKYSTGSIPTLVLGCKYYRVGSGESSGEETENKNLTALICKLTENQPKHVCDSLLDLINQIYD